MRPPDRCLDFFRVHMMPGDMADVVLIPVESLQANEHHSSIYKFGIYTWNGCAGIFAHTSSNQCLTITRDTVAFNQVFGEPAAPSSAMM